MLGVGSGAGAVVLGVCIMSRRARCAECERSNGPHFRGRCVHGGAAPGRLPRRVWVLHVEGNTDYYSAVLGAYSTEARAIEARDADADDEETRGHVIEHRQDDDPSYHAGEDWSRCYGIEELELDQ